MRRKQKARLYGCLCRNDRLDRRLLLLYQQLCKVRKRVCETCKKAERKDH